MGFLKNIGISHAFYAELWGAMEGLELAWNRGYRKVILELGSQTLVQKLQAHQAVDEVSTSLFLRCINIICRNWTIQIKHTYREGNGAVD